MKLSPEWRDGVWSMVAEPSTDEELHAWAVYRGHVWHHDEVAREKAAEEKKRAERARKREHRELDAMLATPAPANDVESAPSTPPSSAALAALAARVRPSFFVHQK